MATDLFNWYVTQQNGRVILNGDLCIVKFRHAEYVDEKRKYKQHTFITNNDEMAGGAGTRFMLFVQKQVLRVKHVDDDIFIECVDGTHYRLINMDNFFISNVDRKQNQISKLGGTQKTKLPSDQEDVLIIFSNPIPKF